MEVENIEFSYGKHKVIDNISFKIIEGEITIVIGANGCGKSTLFNLMTKNLKPEKGRITLSGKNIANISLKNFARQVAIVHQYNTAPDDIIVEKLVGYGRIAYSGFKRSYSDDEKYIKFAMQVTGVSRFSKKQLSALSGGERQRVWIAVALAQNTKIFFLDEPTTYLDKRNQIDILSHVKKHNKEYGITIIMVLHDINQSIAYSNHIIAMKNGKIVAKGNPNEIITEELIKNIYGIELCVKNLENNKFVLNI